MDDRDMQNRVRPSRYQKGIRDQARLALAARFGVELENSTSYQKGYGNRGRKAPLLHLFLIMDSPVALMHHSDTPPDQPKGLRCIDCDLLLATPRGGVSSRAELKTAGREGCRHLRALSARL